MREPGRRLFGDALHIDPLADRRELAAEDDEQDCDQAGSRAGASPPAAWCAPARSEAG